MKTNPNAIKLFILFLLFVNSVYSQTVKLQKPLKDLHPVIHNAQMLPYTQVQYDFESDTLRMNIYSFNTENTRIIKSLNGVQWWDFSAITGKLESAVRCFNSPIVWYGLLHKYDFATRNYFYKKSFSEDNGVTWFETPDTLSDGSVWFGEDHTVTYNLDSNKYYLFLRDQSAVLNQFRKICLVKSNNYTDFTPRKLIFPKDTNNYRNRYSKDHCKTFYNGTMFTTGQNEYWFYCNVYKLDTGYLGNTQDFRDTSGNDNCVWGELMFSQDAENWHRTNDTNAFIPLQNGIRQIFGSPIVIDDTLFIYTFESRNPHLDYNPQDHDWKICRYKLPVNGLRKYKPSLFGTSNN